MFGAVITQGLHIHFVLTLGHVEYQLGVLSKNVIDPSGMSKPLHDGQFVFSMANIFG